MKIKLSLLTALLGTTVSVCGQSGGGFKLVSATITGGGATHASGGSFSLGGTIGQHDAGLAAGGTFRLEGGFWHGLVLVQEPGSPVLGIRLGTRGGAVLHWPVARVGFVLEERAEAETGVWMPVNKTPLDTATEHTVIVSLGGPKKFYRLRKP